MTCKYNNDEHPLLAEKYARDGLSNEQIATKFGISFQTLYNWQNKHIEFFEALKRAKGYDYEEKTTEVEISMDGTPKATKIRTIKKHIAPDVGAIAFWLKNRNPEQWKEISKTDITTNGKDINPIFKGIDLSVTTDDSAGENC